MVVLWCRTIGTQQIRQGGILLGFGCREYNFAGSVLARKEECAEGHRGEVEFVD